MQLHDQFRRRFIELDELYKAIPFRANSMGGMYVPDGQWHGWASSVQHLVRAVFGDTSAHCLNFTAAYAKTNGDESRVRALHSIFHAAKQDFEGGYTFNVELRVSGEVFGDFIVLARHALGEGHKEVAAVLACAALEDSLKRYAMLNRIDTDDKSMAEVINALKASGLVSGAQRSLLDAMPRIRNMAMHAEWAKLSEPDVNSVLGFAEQFLLTKFSGA